MARPSVRPPHLRRRLTALLIAAVLACGIALPVPALGSAGAGIAGREEGAAADGVLVTLEPAAAQLLSSDGESVDEGLAEAGLAVTERIATPEGTAALVAQPASGQSVAEAAAEAASLPGVAAAQPNYVYELVPSLDAPASTLAAAQALARAFDVNDPLAQVTAPGAAPNQYYLAAANVPAAWEQARAEHAVAIAVLDSGASVSHEDLAPNLLSDLAWDAYHDAPLDATANENGDNGGHGSHVAGVAAGATNNGVGMAGASYNADVIPVKVVDDSSRQRATTASVVAGYTYALGLCESGAAPHLRVINLSLGAYGDALNDEALHQAIRTAKDDYGIVTVCAGGNGKGGQPKTDPIYPADFEECVSVTALDADGTNVYWSDYNEYKDISAPGIGIWSVEAGAASGYVAKSGTSQASPLVAGTLALLFAAVPDATVDEACEALYATARPVHDDRNDRTETSGSYGALDAGAAVTYLIEHHASPSFSDVPAGAWYADAVEAAREKGIMNGYEGTDRFGPDDHMLREQAAGVLYNLLGNGASLPAAARQDVDQSAWYADAVNWAVATGTMSGYAGTDRFGVGDAVSREQVACLVANAAQADLANADPTRFEALEGTGEASSWAREALVWAVDRGVINGMENADGTRSLAPTRAVTRAEMAAIMVNATDQGIL